MKKILSVFLSGSLLLSACGNKSRKNTATTDSLTTKTSSVPAEMKPVDAIDTTKFDINKIPIINKDIGKFPYLNAPEGYRYNDFTKSDLETLHYAVDGRLITVEGKTYKSNIYKNEEKESPFNVELVNRAYEKAITDLGGVKISTKVLPGEIEKIGKSILEKENHSYGIIGAHDFTLNHVNTYVIRTAQAEVWIESSFWERGGYINILQKGDAVTPTVSIIKADEIKSDLDKLGKAVLYINFDVDKATLLPDGIKSVNEIVTVLKNNPELKLSIEGYTDNSGQAEKNKTLSIDRANAVLQTLVESGIIASRLKASGFGSAKPIASNATEDGKAKNRRVELVKI